MSDPTPVPSQVAVYYSLATVTVTCGECGATVSTLDAELDERRGLLCLVCFASMP